MQRWDDDEVSEGYWKAVLRLGVPSVIAVFLVWRLSAQYDMFENRLQALSVQHQSMLDATARLERTMDFTYTSSQNVLYVLRTMCVQSAKTQNERRECIQDAR